MLTKQELESALKDAMRSADEVRKRTLRMVLAAVKLAEVEKRGPLDEPGLLAVMRKEMKTRQESIEEAQRAGRQDLVSATQAEVAVLEGYLPQPLSPADLEMLARQVIAETGAAGPQDLGKVMKQLLPRLQGRADGKVASDLVRGLLTRV